MSAPPGERWEVVAPKHRNHAGATLDIRRVGSDPKAWASHVAAVYCASDNADAHAKLIAAAPALADALAEYVSEVDRDGWPSAEWSDANLERMRAALRLAGRLP